MRSFDVPVCRYDRLLSQMLGPDNLLDSGLHAIACQLLALPTFLLASEHSSHPAIVVSGTVKCLGWEFGRAETVTLRSFR